MTKLPHYVLPTYPAIALLSARALWEGFPAIVERRWKWLPPLACTLWLLAGTGLAVTAIYVPFFTNHTMIVAQAIAGFILLSLAGGAIFFLLERKDISVLLLTVGNLIFVFCVAVITIPNLQHLWLSRDVVQLAEPAKPCDSFDLVSATYNEPSLIFLAGTKTEFTASGADAAKAIASDHCKLALIDGEHMSLFRDEIAALRTEPVSVGTIEGFNIGRGSALKLELFKMPKVTNAP
jgi:4-amino-4-deoxy-L-arabinose transferase-like glycosyltransferase